MSRRLINSCKLQIKLETHIVHITFTILICSLHCLVYGLFLLVLLHKRILICNFLHLLRHASNYIRFFLLGPPVITICIPTFHRSCLGSLRSTQVFQVFILMLPFIRTAKLRSRSNLDIDRLWRVTLIGSQNCTPSFTICVRLNSITHGLIVLFPTHFLFL